MSVITTSDEKRASAKKHIETAIKDLSSIVIDKEWGWDNFTPEFMAEMTQVMVELMRIAERL